MAEKTVPETQVAKSSGENVPAATREQTRYLVPAVDIFDVDNGLMLLCDMPGVKGDQFDIRVEKGVLTIRGKMSREQETDPLYREFELLDYFRQFELSDEVDHERITAELKNGVLTLSLPRAEKAQPRQIEVKTT
jgi:HSP20 family molecular chaperone IbpA